MGGSSKPASSTQTVKAKPFGGTGRLLRANAAETDKLATPELFTPQYSNSTMAGLSGIEGVAGAPSAGAAAQNAGLGILGDAFPAGVDQLKQTAQGSNLFGNPYLDQSLGYQMDDVQERINSQFSGAGRLGSGMHQSVLAREMGRLGTESAQRNYDTERGYQVGAAGQLAGLGQGFAGLAPQLDQGSLFGSNEYLRAGLARDQMTEAQRKAGLNALDYERQSLLPIAGLGGTETTGTAAAAGPNKTAMYAGYGTAALGALLAIPTGGASLTLTAAGIAAAEQQRRAAAG